MLIQAILIGLVGVFGLSEYIFGSNMLERPIVTGALVGLILGDPVQGVIIGGSLELAFMGIMYIGGAVSMNVLVGGVVGTALALMTGNGVEVATTLAIPVGVLYNLMERGYYIVIQYFVHKADKAAEEGSPHKVAVAHFSTFALWATFTFVVIFAAIMLGSSTVETIVNQIPQIIIDGLQAGTLLLPALGFGLLLNLIWNVKIAPFFFIGFVLAAYLSMDTMAVAIIGGAIAVLFYFFGTRDNTSSNVSLDGSERKVETLLSKKDLNRVFLRSFTLEASFNYERFHGVGYCYSMIPVLEKLYPEHDDMVAALKRHLVFFNTSPQLVTFVMGMSAAMEEEYAQTKAFDPETINMIKVALMGPLAGVGDSFWWGIVRTVASGIACQLALDGNLLAPIVFIVLFNVPHVLIRYLGMKYSYKFGKAFIAKISQDNLLQRISMCAGIMGLMVIGSMTVSMVGVTTPLTFAIGDMEPIAVQSVLDQILPGMLSLLTVFIVSKLLKKNVKVMTLMLILLVAGVVLTVIGIL